MKCARLNVTKAERPVVVLMARGYKPWPKHGSYAGWDQDGRHLVFKHPHGAPYYIDTRSVRTQEDVGDWYDHMLGKAWVSHEMAGEMLYDMNEWIVKRGTNRSPDLPPPPEPLKRRVHPERAKMRPSLRFKILQRDGFKCVLCGLEAAQGARLHVDHKVAIANGGKTEDANLQTLCSTCNLGKGAA